MCNMCVCTAHTRCCPMKSRPQFYRLPASGRKTRPGGKKRVGESLSEQSMIGSTRRDGEQEREELCTMLEKDMLLWKSFSSLENIFRVESEDREVRGHTGFVAQVYFTCKVLLT